MFAGLFLFYSHRGVDAPVRGGRFLIGWNPPNSHSFFKKQSLAAVLVAIAIPVFTQQLEKSREATDSSNIRAAYAEVMTDALVDSKTDSTRTVALKQQVDDWQNAEDQTNLESLAVTEDAAKGVMGVEVDLSGVGNGKSVTVSYDADGGTGGLGKVSIAVAGGTTP